MKYRAIIHDAWVFTQENKPLIRWYLFVPTLLSTVYGILYTLYQFYAFKSSPIFEGWEHSFLSQVIHFIFDFIAEDPSTAFPFIITVVILGILYLLLPALTQGAVIQLTARRYNGQAVRNIEGIKYGLLSFLRLFKFQLLARGLSIVSILAPAAIILRTLGIGILPFVTVIFSIFVVIAFILSLLFTYAEFFIVVDAEDVFPSISKSCSLVVSHWQMTFLIGILMLIIGVRIILQVLTVLLIPTIIIVITGYFATVTFATVGVYISLGLGLIVLLFSVYLSATIHMFATAVWTITFLKLSNEEESSPREESVPSAPNTSPIQPISEE